MKQRLSFKPRLVAIVTVLTLISGTVFGQDGEAPQQSGLQVIAGFLVLALAIVLPLFKKPKTGNIAR